jgi:hypothetical protein
MNEVASLCRYYQDLIQEQSLAMNQMAADFQEQLATMARNCRQTIAEMDRSYRLAVQQNQSAALPTSQNWYAPAEPGRSRRRRRGSDEEDQYEQNDIERRFRVWKREGRSVR